MGSADRVLCIVPARGGSRRFPGKNTAPLAGKPLIAWTVEAALASEIFTRVWVTSDDPAILQAGSRAGGVPHSRPARLADDTTTVAQVCAEMAREFAARGSVPEAVYVLLPTSPLRSAESIRRAWGLFGDSDADALTSVTPLPHPPEWALTVERGWVSPADPAQYETPRNRLPQRYRADGGHSIVRTNVLLETQRLIGPRTLAFEPPADEVVDIDESQDLAWAEFLLARRRCAR